LSAPGPEDRLAFGFRPASAMCVSSRVLVVILTQAISWSLFIA
jgi:hypothetical protein